MDTTVPGRLGRQCHGHGLLLGTGELAWVSDSIRSSLLPRSITTHFPMIISDEIGGLPQLAAIFVLITGVLGGLIGEILLHILPLRSTMAQ